MKTKTFLTPATHEHSGVVLGIEYDEEQSPLFAEPVPYWSANDAELRQLRTKVPQANAELRHAKARHAPVARQSESVQNQRGWDAFLRDLDARLAKRALRGLSGVTTPPSAAHLANTCCTGQYLCPECRTKAIAAA